MKAKRIEKRKKASSHILRKILIICLFLVSVAVVMNLAPNYRKDELEGKLKLIINQNDVTISLKQDIYVEDNIFLLKILQISLMKIYFMIINMIS